MTMFTVFAFSSIAFSIIVRSRKWSFGGHSTLQAALVRRAPSKRSEFRLQLSLGHSRVTVYGPDQA
jgi:hypothetical protein